MKEELNIKISKNKILLSGLFTSFPTLPEPGRLTCRVQPVPAGGHQRQRPGGPAVLQQTHFNER